MVVESTQTRFRIVPMEPHFKHALARNADTDKTEFSTSIWSRRAKEREPISFDLGADDLSKLRCDLDHVLVEFPVRTRDVQ